MRRVLLTHVDSILGRRLLKSLYHDPEVALVFATGLGSRPAFVDAYADKCVYQRIDLARVRHLSSFFRSERFARARLDSVIHLPFATEGAEDGRQTIPGNIPALVSETRRLVEECKKQPRLERFIYLSSGFVYQAEPGNVSIFNEDQVLGFEVPGDAQVQAWIDADLICQSEIHGPHLRMTILRSATILTEGGEFLQSPPLAAGPPPIGFDPMLSIVADRDLARSVILALHGDLPGIYNIAGRETFPCSALRPSVWPPGLFPARLSATGTLLFFERILARGLGRNRASGCQRYGMVLDTRRAQEALGFEPHYRIEVRGSGSMKRVDMVRAV